MSKPMIILSAWLLMGSVLAGGLSLQAAEEAKPEGPQPELKARPAPPDSKVAPTNARPAFRDKTDFLARYLDLTEKQQEKLRPIFTEESKKIGDLRKATDASAEQRRKQYQEIRETTDARIKEVLTAEQWDKYSKRGQRPASVPPGSPPPVRPAK